MSVLTSRDRGPEMPEGRPAIRAFPPGTAYIEGRFCAIAEAKISVLDWGFLRSDATYDVVHVWNGRFFRLDQHIDRFYRSMAGFRMSITESKDELKAILCACVRLDRE